MLANVDITVMILNLIDWVNSAADSILSATGLTGQAVVAFAVVAYLISLALHGPPG
jgi:hypothetical protein